MKTIFRKDDLHKVNLSSNFSSVHKCKVCKTKFVFGVDKNLKIIKGLIKQNNEYKTEKRYIWGLFPSTTEYVRNVFEVVSLHVAVCPNCGKEKVKFYSENKEKEFEYSEWQDDSNYYYYY